MSAEDFEYLLEELEENDVYEVSVSSRAAAGSRIPEVCLKQHPQMNHEVVPLSMEDQFVCLTHPRT